jgi:hypothetical protein
MGLCLAGLCSWVLDASRKCYAFDGDDESWSSSPGLLGTISQLFFPRLEKTGSYQAQYIAGVHAKHAVVLPSARAFRRTHALFHQVWVEMGNSAPSGIPYGLQGDHCIMPRHQDGCFVMA